MDLGAVQCVECDKTFTRKHSLQRHITAFHFKESCEIFKCSFCKYSSKRKENLKRHSENCQKRHFDGIVQKLFKCSKCSASYKFVKSLKRHEKKHHGKGNNSKLTLIHKRKCPICPFESSELNVKDIYLHFEKVHNICLKWENHSFVSVDEFNDWKSQVEKLVGSSFVKRSLTKSTITFKCRRCGSFKPAGKNKRRLKITGTCKINGFCPAFIKIKIKNDCVDALYQSVHVGHEHELQHQRLSKEDKEYLASKLAEKVPHEEILKNIRASVSNNELQRIHLINKKDLSNIERDFKLKEEAPRHHGMEFEEQVLEEHVLDDDFNVLELVLEEDSQDDKNNLEEKWKLLSLEMNKLQTILKNNLTTDQIDFILKTIKSLNRTIKAMEPSPISLQVTDTNQKPASTKVMKQRRFTAPFKKRRKKVILIVNKSLNQAEPASNAIYSDHTY